MFRELACARMTVSLIPISACLVEKHQHGLE